jgi:hypothetical protein
MFSARRSLHAAIANGIIFAFRAVFFQDQSKRTFNRMIYL